MLAIRFAAAAFVTLVLPGLLFSVWLRIRARLAERIVLSFAVSYAWIFLLSAIIPLFELTIHAVLYLTIPLCALLCAGIWRRGGLRPPSFSLPPPMAVVLGAAVILFVTAAWFIEAPITGEEALDLTSATRFADGGTVDFHNTSLLPDTVPVYLFQPYQLAVGAIIRFGHIDPFVAFVKLRSVLMLLTLASLYSLLRRLSPSRAVGDAAFAVALLFVAVDLATWEYNSLFPFVRRGGVSAGVLVPALMLLALLATRTSVSADDRRLRLVAGWTLPFLLMASLSTHPLEMATYLCFLGALAVAVLTRLDPGGDRRAVVWLVAAVMLTVGVYFSIHDRAVSVVTEFEAPQKQSQLNYFGEQLKFPARLLFGRMSNDTKDLFGRLLPNTISGVIGIPALLVLAWTAPSAAALLTLALVPLVVMYASPAGFLILSLLTSQATVHDVNAYFGLLGLLSVSLAAAGTAHWVLSAAGRPRSWLVRALTATAAGAALTGFAWQVLSRAESKALAATASKPWAGVAAAGLIGLVVLIVVLMRRRSDLTTSAKATVVPYTPYRGLVTAAIAVLAALPLTRAGRNPDRLLDTEAGILARYQHARTEPSVVDWPSYYAVLRESIRPKLPVPQPVVDALRRVLPPRQIVLADPRYSCGLVVLFNAYCVNPESIYGHYFLTAAHYFDRYVRQGDDGGPWHPFFNRTPAMTDVERRFLEESRANYLVVDPDLADSIRRKLSESDRGVVAESLAEGWVLFKLAPAAGGPLFSRPHS